MAIEKFGEFPPPLSSPEKPKTMKEKIKEFKEGLLGKAEEIFNRLGADYNGEKARERTRELNPQEEGEDDMFADFEAHLNSEPVSLRLVGQYDENYNPDREKDYEKWDLTSTEEAGRWLNREIIVNEKLKKFYQGENIMADELIEAQCHVPAQDMYLLKKRVERHGNPEEYGEKEGRAIARTLLNLQNNLKGTDMVNEIMAEEGIKTKLELEQKIFEDYFDHFPGYQENTSVILNEMEHEIKDEIEKALEKYKEIIESRQLVGNEHSLAHGGCNLETVIFTKEGKALLADWKRAGTTQNRELSLVYDLGDIINDKIENTQSLENIEEFIKGIEEEIKERYDKEDPSKGEDVAEAIMNLTKFRSLAMIVDGLAGEKKEYVLKQLRFAIAMIEKR